MIWSTHTHLKGCSTKATLHKYDSKRLLDLGCHSGNFFLLACKRARPLPHCCWKGFKYHQVQSNITADTDKPSKLIGYQCPPWAALHQYLTGHIQLNTKFVEFKQSDPNNFESFPRMFCWYVLKEWRNYRQLADFTHFTLHLEKEAPHGLLPSLVLRRHCPHLRKRPAVVEMPHDLWDKKTWHKMRQRIWSTTPVTSWLPMSRISKLTWDFFSLV